MRTAGTGKRLKPKGGAASGAYGVVGVFFVCVCVCFFFLFFFFGGGGLG